MPLRKAIGNAVTQTFNSFLVVAAGSNFDQALGPEAELLAGAPYELTRLQALFLFTRADTLYGGSSEIQRNIIAERALGMPREAR